MVLEVQRKVQLEMMTGCRMSVNHHAQERLMIEDQLRKNIGKNLDAYMVSLLARRGMAPSELGPAIGLPCFTDDVPGIGIQGGRWGEGFGRGMRLD